MCCIGIFGIEDKTKEAGSINGVICPSCGRYASAVINEAYTCFHLFFIPIFRWNRRFLIILSCCRCVYETDADTARSFMETGVIDFEKTRRISAGFAQFNPDDFGQDEKKCPACARSYPAKYPHCPYCGTKF